MKAIYILFLTLFLLGCTDDFLNTPNPNAPNLEQALGDPNEWEAIIARQFPVIFQATQGVHAGVTMAAMADVYASSTASLSLEYHSLEPRQAIDNWQGNLFVEFSYYQNFQVIGSVNDILRKLNENPELNLSSKEKLRSVAFFLRGMAYGNLALKYDQAQYVDESMEVSNVFDFPFDSYEQLSEKAITDLTSAITIAEKASGINIPYFNGLDLSQKAYLEFIRTLQAKILVHRSRDEQENEANDWLRILEFARNGISYDFTLEGDGHSLWWDDYKNTIADTRESSCLRVDHRVIAAMAEGIAPYFPDNMMDPIPEPKAIDQRLKTDMYYFLNTSCIPSRAAYHNSHYGHARYASHFGTFTGPIPFILKAENDLIIAEALIRSGGDKKEAADLINLTRVGRGGLTSLTGGEPNQELIDAIMHERFIELMATNGGQPFYDRRRLPDDDGSYHPYSGLQANTPRQFPVPAKDLNVLGMELYTF